MTIEQRIEALDALGNYIQEFDERLKAHMHRAQSNNGWFTKENQETALETIAEQYLDKSLLHAWIEKYDVSDTERKTVGIIAAGNLPLVAFHDVLSVFVAGHISRIKLSERDQYLLPYLIKRLGEIDARTQEYFHFVDKLSDFDAVIATGSNNSARYFEQYFGKYPNIIRKNRNAVAVLAGDETARELQGLADDVFRYFGMGCRNVSAMYVPLGYDLEKLREPFSKYSEILDHSKYRNNFGYNLAIYLLNKEDHVNLDNVLLKRSDKYISPIGTLHYTHYDSLENLGEELNSRRDEIQCVVGRPGDIFETVPFGEAQSPGLTDYADGVDTMQFLTTLTQR